MGLPLDVVKQFFGVDAVVIIRYIDHIVLGMFSTVKQIDEAARVMFAQVARDFRQGAASAKPYHTPRDGAQRKERLFSASRVCASGFAVKEISIAPGRVPELMV